MVLTSDIIAIGVVIGMVAILTLPKKIVYAINGSLLIGFGLLPLLNYFNVIAFDIYSFPVTRYLVLFTVIVAGRELFKEGLKEKAGVGTFLRIPSMALGLGVIILTAIPTLSALGAISFTLPEYSTIVDFAIYLAAGILLLIGIKEASEL